MIDLHRHFPWNVPDLLSIWKAFSIENNLNISFLILLWFWSFPCIWQFSSSCDLNEYFWGLAISNAHFLLHLHLTKNSWKVKWACLERQTFHVVFMGVSLLIKKKCNYTGREGVQKILRTILSPQKS